MSIGEAWKEEGVGSSLEFTRGVLLHAVLHFVVLLGDGFETEKDPDWGWDEGPPECKYISSRSAATKLAIFKISVACNSQLYPAVSPSQLY